MFYGSFFVLCAAENLKKEQNSLGKDGPPPKENPDSQVTLNPGHEGHEGQGREKSGDTQTGRD